jgi:2-desacetyl-2-hydroxyethyl bacteriochlorophyllide A dehydrogenase
MPANNPGAAFQIVFTQKGRVVCRPVEQVKVAPGEVLVQTHFSVISPGTELAFLTQQPNTITEYPFLPGYSVAGEVSAIGKEVQGIEVGEKIAVQMPHISVASVPPEQCWKIPTSLSLREAAAFRLVSIPLQGLRKARVQLGESTLVMGLGIIGNIAGQLAHASGSTLVIGVDLQAERRELAKQCSFDQVLGLDELAAVHNMTADEGPRVVIEATGRPEAINAALEIAGRRARVVLLGSARGLTKEVDFYTHVHKKGLTIIGAHESIRAQSEDVDAYFTHRSDGRTALELMALKRVQIEPLISTTYPATQAPEAYRALLDQPQSLMSSVLDWNIPS